MSKEIKLFKNEEFGEIRTLLINDEPYFVGKDVVVALGYDLSTNRYGEYIKKHCDKEDYILYDKTGLQNTIEF